VGRLYSLCGVIYLLAGLENLALVWLLAEWKPDFKGGLFAVLAVRRERFDLGTGDPSR
jgi:hypothetical protein